MMSKVRRYNPDTDCESPMYVCPNGDYVTWEDYEDVVSELLKFAPPELLAEKEWQPIVAQVRGEK